MPGREQVPYRTDLSKLIREYWAPCPVLHHQWPWELQGIFPAYICKCSLRVYFRKMGQR